MFHSVMLLGHFLVQCTHCIHTHLAVSNTEGLLFLGAKGSEDRGIITVASPPHSSDVYNNKTQHSAHGHGLASRSIIRRNPALRPYRLPVWPSQQRVNNINAHTTRINQKSAAARECPACMPGCRCNAPIIVIFIFVFISSHSKPLRVAHTPSLLRSTKRLHMIRLIFLFWFCFSVPQCTHGDRRCTY